MGNEFSYLSELGSEKGDLIKGLQLVQSREGYVSDDAIRAISKHFSIAEAEVEVFSHSMPSSNARNPENTKSVSATEPPAISKGPS